MVSTIGMGSPNGAPIPEYRNGQPAGYKTDHNGQTVTTRLDEATLSQIAQTGGGIYIRAANITAGLSQVVKQLDKMEQDQHGRPTSPPTKAATPIPCPGPPVLCWNSSSWRKRTKSSTLENS